MPQYDVFFKELFRFALFRFLACFAPELAAGLDSSHPGVPGDPLRFGVPRAGGGRTGAGGVH